MQLTFMYLMQQVRDKFHFEPMQIQDKPNRSMYVIMDNTGLFGSPVDQVDVADLIGDAKVFSDIMTDNEVPHSRPSYGPFSFASKENAIKAIHILIFLIAYTQMLNAGHRPYPLDKESEDIHTSLSLKKRKLTDILDERRNM